MAEPKFVFNEEDYKWDNEEIEIERAEAERIYFREIKPRSEKRAETYQNKFDRLYDHAKNKGISVDNLFLDIEFKREALKTILGYKSLKGFSSIDEASDQAIANVYRKAYYSSEHAKRH